MKTNKIILLITIIVLPISIWIASNYESKERRYPNVKYINTLVSVKSNFNKSKSLILLDTHPQIIVNINSEIYEKAKITLSSKKPICLRIMMYISINNNNDIIYKIDDEGDIIQNNHMKEMCSK